MRYDMYRFSIYIFNQSINTLGECVNNAQKVERNRRKMLTTLLNSSIYVHNYHFDYCEFYTYSFFVGMWIVSWTDTLIFYSLLRSFACFFVFLCFYTKFVIFLFSFHQNFMISNKTEWNEPSDKKAPKKMKTIKMMSSVCFVS